jgi:hypothetical protein
MAANPRSRLRCVDRITVFQVYDASIVSYCHWKASPHPFEHMQPQEAPQRYPSVDLHIGNNVDTQKTCATIKCYSFNLHNRLGRVFPLVYYIFYRLKRASFAVSQVFREPICYIEYASDSFAPGLLSLASVKPCGSLINTWVCSLGISFCPGTLSFRSERLTCSGR